MSKPSGSVSRRRSRSGSAVRPARSLSYMLLDQDNVPGLRHSVRPGDQHRRLPNLRTSRRRSITTIITACSSATARRLRSNIVTFALEHDLTDDIRAREHHPLRPCHPRFDLFVAALRQQRPTRLITPQTQSRDTVDEILLNQTNLFAKFDTGSVRHDLIAGFEISREKSRNQLRAITAGHADRPVRSGSGARPGTARSSTFPARSSAPRPTRSPAYLFDTVHFSEQLLLSGGIRWERYESEYPSGAAQRRLRRISTGPTSTSPGAPGVTYKPVPALSLYAGAGTSVNPSIENMTQTTPTAALGGAQAGEQPDLRSRRQMGRL